MKLVYCLFFCVGSLAAQAVSISVTLSDRVVAGPAIVAGQPVPQVTFATVAKPLDRFPVFNAEIPLGVPIQFYIDAIPAGVEELHYYLASNGSPPKVPPVPNGKQIFNPPSLHSDPYTVVNAGIDSIVVWWPHPGDDPATANQQFATRLQTPFTGIAQPTPANSATRSGNTLSITCGPKLLSIVTPLPVVAPGLTTGIGTLVSMLKPTAGGTEVSAALDGAACFPAPVLVP